MSIADVVQVASDVVVAAAAGWAAVLAYQGLTTWRAQQNYDHARRVLEVAVALRNRVLELRQRAYGPGYWTPPFQDLHAEIRAGLASGKAAALLADLLASTQLEPAWDGFQKVIWEYVTALSQLQHADNDPGYAQRQHARIEGWQSTIWSGGPDDPYEVCLGEALQVLRGAAATLLKT